MDSNSIVHVNDANEDVQKRKETDTINPKVLKKPKHAIPSVSNKLPSYEAEVLSDQLVTEILSQTNERSGEIRKFRGGILVEQKNDHLEDEFVSNLLTSTKENSDDKHLKIVDHELIAKLEIVMNASNVKRFGPFDSIILHDQFLSNNSEVFFNVVLLREWANGVVNYPVKVTLNQNDRIDYEIDEIELLLRVYAKDKRFIFASLKTMKTDEIGFQFFNFSESEIQLKKITARNIEKAEKLRHSFNEVFNKICSGVRISTDE